MEKMQMRFTMLCVSNSCMIAHVSSVKIAVQTLKLSIKWPNDLYADGMKIGGILCNSTYSDKKFNVVVGKLPTHIRG